MAHTGKWLPAPMSTIAYPIRFQALLPSLQMMSGRLEATEMPPIPSKTLIEHWNGAQWSIVQSQGTGGLSGVAAIASNDVWAVGAISGNNIQALTEHWSGGSCSCARYE